MMNVIMNPVMTFRISIRKFWRDDFATHSMVHKLIEEHLSQHTSLYQRSTRFRIPQSKCHHGEEQDQEEMFLSVE